MAKNKKDNTSTQFKKQAEYAQVEENIKVEETIKDETIDTPEEVSLSPKYDTKSILEDYDKGMKNLRHLKTKYGMNMQDLYQLVKEHKS